MVNIKYYHIIIVLYKIKSKYYVQTQSLEYFYDYYL